MLIDQNNGQSKESSDDDAESECKRNVIDDLESIKDNLILSQIKDRRKFLERRLFFIDPKTEAPDSAFIKSNL